MTGTEWNQGGEAPASVALPAMVSSTDLFDGELFGDELIDIYNSTVNEDGGDLNGIPSLDPPSGAKEDEVDSEHPGAQVAVAAAAMDDGLGAFRPSTSFNDLTTLMQTEHEGKPAEAPVAPTVTADTTPAMPPVAAAPAATATTTTVTSTTATKKRPATASPDSPAPKRKNTAARPRKSPAKKQTSPIAKAKIAVPQEKVASKPSGSSVVTPPVNAVGEHAAATAAAVEAAAAAAAASFPSLPDLATGPTVVTSGVTLTMKPDAKPVEATPAAPIVAGAQKAAAAVPAQKVTSEASKTSGDSNADTQFKSIAQQAVSNLIMNANPNVRPTPAAAKSKATSVSKDDKSKVDTSTAHIKALTGNNWVAACAGTSSNAQGGPPSPTPAAVAPPPPAAPVPAPQPAAAATNANAASADKNNRIRRQNLTPDERARQNRDRNREHARNTRLRKKAYVEELKRTLTELVAQRDAADLEKRQTAQREMEQREVRFRVIEEFLKLRGRNESNFTRWAAILEDGFVLTVPSATSLYKNTAASEVDGFEQHLGTVEVVMAESTVFSSFLQSIRGGASEGAGVTMQFDCDRKNFFMDSCNAVLEWTSSAVGSKHELVMKGLIRGKFSPASNKLLSASISFDCGALAAQLQLHKSATGGDEVAAEAAASQADAILDSLEINHVHLNVVSPSDVSEKGVESSDEQSTTDHPNEDPNNNNTSVDKQDAKEAAEGEGDGLGMTTRRVQRRD
eukprot:CAMPEP_0172472360 /NCGR_PEP_ID=MMETSP1065-20121228/68294_1 /TAXON_ID=265537 /ORGANISM="Amphiprora paludosa, Strain CCMP125" /LENGTH=735 /DNA_ID=CAMNT_0013230495 /DNA_START=1013 /DNA_END=3220 /DNA_ORIENTATION=+